MDKRQIPYAWHDVGQEEADAVTDVLLNEPLTCGKKVVQFEHDFAAYVGARNAVAVSSGTSALEIALTALDIGGTSKGKWREKKEALRHEVIVPSLTMAATAIAVIRVGARPKFADINKRTMQIDLESVESLINPNTRAIIVVHFGGEPGPVAELLALARSKGIAVIEDAAHATGARYQHDETRIGSHPNTVSCFSFHPCKHITTGEGGMITCRDDRLAARCRRLRWFGLEPGKNGGPTTIKVLGTKANLTDVQAAIGIEQLKKLDRFLEGRNRVAKRYQENFAVADIDGLNFPVWTWGKTAWHLFPILAWRDRNMLKAELGKAGVGTSIHYHPVHLHPWFRDARSWLGFRDVNCPTAESIALQELSLPMWPGLTDEDVDYIVEAVVTASEKSRRGGERSLAAAQYTEV